MFYRPVYRCTPILCLKPYYEKIKKKNNINKTDLGNYKHLKRRNIINDIVITI